MSHGNPISRHWIVTLKNEVIVIDWGNGLFQDLSTGEFFLGSEKDIAHTAFDSELDMLERSGHIVDFDGNTVFTGSLPEPPRGTID
jgi:hypothetical protein